MQKKPIIIVSIILSSVLLAGLAIIFVFQSPLYNKDISVVESKVVNAADTLSLPDYLKEFLDVKQTKTKSVNKGAKREYEKACKIDDKTKKIDVWLLGQGRTIIYYLWQIQNKIEERKGKVLHMNELFYERSSLASSVFQAACIQFTDSTGNTSNVELQISKKLFIKGGNSKLAIVFEGINLDKQENIDFLNKLEYPHSVLITPWKLSPEKLNELRSSKKRSLVLWLFMESTKINQASIRPIRFHHTESDIEQNIKDAFAILPEAKGIATRYGEQAVEHYNLLRATLLPLQEHSVYFLDLTRSNSSLSKQVCEELELLCDNPEAYNADNSIPKDYIRKKLAEAAKNGNAIIILPLNSNIQKELEDIEERAKKQGTEITTLDSLVEQRQ
jgi:polysaccharide deacetylase 2 family uncharacterized protein YibQ